MNIATGSPPDMTPRKRRAAAVSIASNVTLIRRLGLHRAHGARDRVAGTRRRRGARTDAYTSIAVVAGLALVEITGAAWLDPAVAMVVAGAIVSAGWRILMRSSCVLVDEALPAEELEAIRDEVVAFGGRGVVGYHKLRTRRAGARRYVDLHLQFRSGTRLEQAHRIAHEIQDEIAGRLHGADVLIHLEPEDRVEPGWEIEPPGPHGPGARPTSG